ncbi:MAG: leucine-rich repeat protein [Clostridia bacterium]|nr:leucine-rich repeat protein [Clostridia bacterium]
MHKKIISVLIASLICLMVLLPLSGCSNSNDKDKFKYSLSDDGATITGYTGSSSVISIPKELDNKPVVSIARTAFQYNGSVTKIKIPETVTEIADGSFTYCGKLKAINVNKKIPLTQVKAEYCSTKK